jgi:acid phosphatase
MYRLLLAMAVSSIGCASVMHPQVENPPVTRTEGRDSHELLNSVLWIQTSAEYDTLSRLMFRQAQEALIRARADKTWTAALEQSGDFANLPDAIIVDIDDTVLDNSPFQGKLVAARTRYNQPLWDDWAARAQAKSTPGASEFLSFARDNSVVVFYVTNRYFKQEKDTVANLQKRGFPVDAAGTLVLSRNEMPNWGSDKSSRRRAIAETHRILLLIGDDLGDFVSGARVTPKNRVQLAQKYASLWGTRWFLLPNPMYGTWEYALFDHNLRLPDNEILQRKLDAIEVFD